MLSLEHTHLTHIRRRPYTSATYTACINRYVYRLATWSDWLCYGEHEQINSCWLNIDCVVVGVRSEALTLHGRHRRRRCVTTCTIRIWRTIDITQHIHRFVACGDYWMATITVDCDTYTIAIDRSGDTDAIHWQWFACTIRAWWWRTMAPIWRHRHRTEAWRQISGVIASSIDGVAPLSGGRYRIPLHHGGIPPDTPWRQWPPIPRLKDSISVLTDCYNNTD